MRINGYKIIKIFQAYKQMIQTVETGNEECLRSHLQEHYLQKHDKLGCHSPLDELKKINHIRYYV